MDRLAAVFLINVVFLLICPSSLLALAVWEYTCFFQVSFDDNHTPRSFSFSVVLIKSFPNLYDDVTGAIFRVIRWCLHFDWLNDNPETEDQYSKFARSVWRDSTSSRDLMDENTFVSSANIATSLDLTTSGRLFTYRRKSAGTRIDPCGTPEHTGSGSEVAPVTTTRWRRSVKYEWNQLSRLPPMPELASFCNKCFLSNAFCQMLSTYRDRLCLLDLLDLGSFQYSPVHLANSWHKIYPGENHVDCYVLFGTSDHECCWKCSVLRLLKRSAREMGR